jgi:hypothetical protein
MTKTISEEKKEDFDIILKQKLCCKSRKFNEILIKGDPSEQDMLEIEIFLSMECPEFYMLVKLYENARIRKANIKKIIDDPTTQEKP